MAGGGTSNKARAEQRMGPLEGERRSTRISNQSVSESTKQGGAEIADHDNGCGGAYLSVPEVEVEHEDNGEEHKDNEDEDDDDAQNWADTDNGEKGVRNAKQILDSIKDKSNAAGQPQGLRSNKRTLMSCNGRVAGRILVPWHRSRMYEKLLLTLQFVCSMQGVALPWDEIIRYFSPGSGKGAILQHLTKVRDELLVLGHMVPPQLNKAKNPSVQHIRGYTRDLDSTDPGALNEVLFTDTYHHPAADIEFEGRFKGSGNYRKSLATYSKEMTTLTFKKQQTPKVKTEDDSNETAAMITPTSANKRKRAERNRIKSEPDADSASDSEEYTPTKKPSRSNYKRSGLSSGLRKTTLAAETPSTPTRRSGRFKKITKSKLLFAKEVLPEEGNAIEESSDAGKTEAQPLLTLRLPKKFLRRFAHELCAEDVAETPNDEDPFGVTPASPVDQLHQYRRGRQSSDQSSFSRYFEDRGQEEEGETSVVAADNVHRETGEEFQGVEDHSISPKLENGISPEPINDYERRIRDFENIWMPLGGSGYMREFLNNYTPGGPAAHQQMMGPQMHAHNGAFGMGGHLAQSYAPPPSDLLDYHNCVEGPPPSAAPIQGPGNVNMDVSTFTYDPQVPIDNGVMSYQPLSPAQAFQVPIDNDVMSYQPLSPAQAFQVPIDNDVMSYQPLSLAQAAQIDDPWEDMMNLEAVEEDANGNWQIPK